MFSKVKSVNSWLHSITTLKKGFPKLDWNETTYETYGTGKTNNQKQKKRKKMT
jgi:hypothetical protein